MSKSRPSRPDRARRQSIAQTLHFSNAGAFVDALRPGSPQLGMDEWIFRGHASASYKLIPSALRSSGEFKNRYFDDKSSELGQVLGEFKALREFFTIADRHGVLPPDIGHHLHGIFDSWHTPPIYEEIQTGRRSWLPDELLYLAAIAQHYGVPTRLLDWTQHSLIAAYFAAKENVRGPVKGPRLAVWAFNASVYLTRRRHGTSRDCVWPRAGHSASLDRRIGCRQREHSRPAWRVHAVPTQGGPSSRRSAATRQTTGQCQPHVEARPSVQDPLGDAAFHAAHRSSRRVDAAARGRGCHGCSALSRVGWCRHFNA